MIALTFLAIVIVYIGVAWFAAKGVTYAFESDRAKKIAKVLTLIVFALIPTWDIIPGKVYFNHLCETEGGLKIYKTVEKVEGFYYFPGAEFRQEALNQYGYKYIEAGAESSLYRYSSKQGSLAKEKISKVSSDYGIQRISMGALFDIKRHSEVILKLQTKEVLSTKTQFYYPGNWVQRKLKPLLGGGEMCPLLPPDSALEKEFYIHTLKPTNN